MDTRPISLHEMFEFDDAFLDVELLHAKKKGLNPREVASDIFVFPCLSEHFCSALSTISDAYNNWEREPGDEYSAPELRLRKLMPVLEDHIAEVVSKYINAVVRKLFLNKYRVGWISAPFIIRYTPETQASMGLHYDGLSEITISIPLSSDFVGGGLSFPRQQYTTNNVKVGNAILFPGGPSHVHRALPVTSGSRHSLTIWTRSEPPNDE